MIAVDTNVLLRLLVGDDASQAAKARRLFDRAAAKQKTIWVSDTVLVELAWTLARAYGRDRACGHRQGAADAVGACYGRPGVGRCNSGRHRRLQAGRADFADCLLSMKAQLAGCDELATFNRGMKGLPGVRLV